jgi:RNA polymerase sigma-70 factor (ECF subfamily)
MDRKESREMSGHHKENHSEIFEELMNCSDTVFQICLGFSRNPWEAEELMQEVYLRAFRKIDSTINGHFSREWLFRIAKNACINHMKKKRLSRIFLMRSGINSVEQNTPEQQVILEEQHLMLKRAIGKLPRRLHEVFVLKEYAHLSCLEIAQTLDIKQGTVLSRLNRARQAIIDRFKEVHNGKK